MEAECPHRVKKGLRPLFPPSPFSSLFNKKGLRPLFHVTGQALHIFNGREGPITSAAFSPNGRYIVTASQQGTVRLWEVESGDPFGIRLAYEGGIIPTILHVAFSPDGRRFIAISGDGKARLWDFETGEALHTPDWYEVGIVDAALSPDGQRIVTGHHDGATRVWRVLPSGQALVELARKQVPNPLTREERRRYYLPSK